MGNQFSVACVQNCANQDMADSLAEAVEREEFSSGADLPKDQKKSHSALQKSGESRSVDSGVGSGRT